MCNLASTYQYQEKYDEAEALQLTATEINERTKGKEHETSIICSNNLAWIWRCQGRKKDALELLTECVGRFETALGTDHPYTVSVTKILRRWSEEQNG